MEMIKNYLETMFQNLPNTNEVQKAKYELGQMMEDKYTELKNEGKSENEAIGTVISEFGNLNEIAQDLGIGSFINTQSFEKVNMLSMNDAKEYIKDKTRAGFMIGIGTLLCIMSPSGFIMGFDVMGLVYLAVAIAVAVGIFIFAGAFEDRWNYIKKEHYSIDFATASYIQHEKDNYRMTNALLIAAGVVLCIMCAVPVIVFANAIGIVELLAMVAIAVLMFIVSGCRSDAYNILLKLNKSDTMGGNFVSSQKEQVRYTNKTIAAIMSVYWPTVTCIYICWSFLTGYWHITWIVWVIAGIVETFIKNFYKN